MQKEIVELSEDVSESSLYSKDLAPVPQDERTWSTMDLAAIWVGMAVCIPTYLLASYMIKTGVSWYSALIIIGLANLIITVPMVLNGHGGVKYGIPFPVIGRSSFGTKGIHIASIMRAIVACGWFGIQTWIGGLAFYAIWNALTGNKGSADLDIGKFIGFALFWMLNMYFIWKGTESIKWLEKFAAPILLLIGVLLIVWGASTTGSFSEVLKQGSQLEHPAVSITETENGDLSLHLNPLLTKDGEFKASEYQITIPLKTKEESLDWTTLNKNENHISLKTLSRRIDIHKLTEENGTIKIQFRAPEADNYYYSSLVEVGISNPAENTFGAKLWGYVLWLTAMVGFWATMSISIADITRYASTQKKQITGQFLGLPGAMILFSFVGIFVTFAAVINFEDILIGDDAPWDPVSLLAKFDSPVVVIIAQVFLLIATLSTNIAANVIAPANAFSNLMPKRISFKTGGTITGVVGILTCPWWLLNEISGILIFISGLLGPVLGILLCEYFVIRKTRLKLADLYKHKGAYTYIAGFNGSAMISLVAGVFLAVIGYWVESLQFLYNLSWFTGFASSFILYYLLMKSHIEKT